MAPSMTAALSETFHHHHLSPSHWNFRPPTDLDALLNDLSHLEIGKAWRDIGGAGALGAVGGTLQLGFKGFGDKVPGLRGGATFLSTLRENIQLSTLDSIQSLPPSPCLFPLCASSHVRCLSAPCISLTEPQHSPKNSDSSSTTAAAAALLTMSASAPLASGSQDEEPAPLPELTTHISTSVEERPAVLKLVADSIAQQRQAAAKALIFHPLSLFLLGIIIALQAQYLSSARLLTTIGGTIMAFLVAVRGYTSGYIFAAENVNGWDWLISDTPPSTKRPAKKDPSSGSTDTNPASPSSGKRSRKNSNDTTIPQIYVTYWGTELIGALVLRVSKRDRTAYVRAWTVKNKYRKKGVGKALLEEGVKGVMLGDGGGIGINKIKNVALEDNHTGSARVFPDAVYGIPTGINRVFDKREDRARRAIDDVVGQTLTQQKSKR